MAVNGLLGKHWQQSVRKNFRPSQITGCNCLSFLPRGSLGPHLQAFSPSQLARSCLNSGWILGRLVLWELRSLALGSCREKHLHGCGRGCSVLIMASRGATTLGQPSWTGLVFGDCAHAPLRTSCPLVLARDLSPEGPHFNPYMPGTV